MQNDNQYRVNQVTISPTLRFTVAETKDDYNVDRPSNFMNTFMGNDDVAEFLGGYNYAVIINKLLMLTENERITGYQSDGKKWIRIGLFAGEEEITWAAMLKCLTPATIKRHLVQLQSDGLIDFKQFKGKGRSLYYWLNIQAIELLSEPVERVSKLHATNAANSAFTQAKYNSDSTNRVINSDSTNRVITSNEPLNQVSRTVELPLTNRVTSKSPKNHKENQESLTTNASKSDAPFLESESDSEFLAELKRLQAINSELSQNNVVASLAIQAKDDSANYPTLGAVVVPPPSAAQNPPPSIDPRVVAYCNALGWVIDGKGVIAKASANVNGLCAFYGDTLTGDDMAAVLAHLKKLDVKMNPTAIKAKFGEAVQDVEIMTNSRNKALVEAIKVMYGQTKGIEYRLEFEYSKLASRMAQQGVTPEMIIAFPAVWESNHNGYNLPGYDNLKLITNIKNMTMKGNGNQATKSAEQTKIEAEAWLAEVTQGVR